VGATEVHDGVEGGVVGTEDVEEGVEELIELLFSGGEGSWGVGIGSGLGRGRRGSRAQDGTWGAGRPRIVDTPAVRHGSDGCESSVIGHQNRFRGEDGAKAWVRFQIF
jgi:hypothetical protein